MKKKKLCFLGIARSKNKTKIKATLRLNGITGTSFIKHKKHGRWVVVVPCWNLRNAQLVSQQERLNI